MSFTSERASFWDGLRRLPSRTPLRVKMITALLALVFIALMTISVAGLIAFQSDLRAQAANQVTSTFNARASQLTTQSGGFGPSGGLRKDDFGLYGPILVELLSTNGQVIFGPLGVSTAGPSVPTSKAWLAAHSGQLAIVPGQSGGDNWQVMAKPFTVTIASNFQVSTQTAILVVGTDLGNVNQNIRKLAGIDLIVSTIIMVGLVVVGIAIVRASLRPLTDIEQTAEAIAAGDLSRRVPDADPGTEVGRLGQSLNSMLTQIETSFHAREQSEAAARRSEERMRQFVADASHELRTPLTAMRGYAEYYRQRGGLGQETMTGEETTTGQAASTPTVGAAIPAGEAAPAGAAPAGAAPAGAAHAQNTAAENAMAGRPAARETSAAFGSNGNGPLTRDDLDRIMHRVEQESARMGVLVEDMLLLARLDQQRPIERRPVDLLTLAADAVQDARMIAPERAIELTVGSGAAFLVLGDEVRLRQVIGNLMSNALTHTPAGTPVEVRILSGILHSTPGVVLEVADQGPGLPASQAERVFERFYRADQARTRRTGGAGLGLAIVAALVAAHGGTVSLDTLPGQGATFRITLPLAPEAQDRQPDQDELPGRGQAARDARAASSTDDR
jgi:two-component system OmpR family sensor kinase